MAHFHFIAIALLLGVLALALWLLFEKRFRKKEPTYLDIVKQLRIKKGAPAGMRIDLCRSSIDRLGSNRDPLLDALRERGHSPVVKECLTRCQDCKLGMLMANVDGIPLQAKNPDALMRDLDELAAEE